MKKLLLVTMIGLAFCYAALAENFKVTTSTSASVDKVGDVNRPGLLFKFDLPAELQNARIDLAVLRFKVETDTTQQTLGLLVRPMLQSWASGTRLSNLSDSTASPRVVNFGNVSLKSGAGKIEITQAVKAWQKGELQNFGFLVYPDEERQGSLQVRNWPSGGVAELEIFYTPQDTK